MAGSPVPQLSPRHPLRSWDRCLLPRSLQQKLMAGSRVRHPPPSRRHLLAFQFELPPRSPNAVHLPPRRAARYRLQLAQRQSTQRRFASRPRRHVSRSRVLPHHVLHQAVPPADPSWVPCLPVPAVPPRRAVRRLAPHRFASRPPQHVSRSRVLPRRAARYQLQLAQRQPAQRRFASRPRRHVSRLRVLPEHVLHQTVPPAGPS